MSIRRLLEEELIIISGQSEDAINAAMSRVLVQSTKKVKPKPAHFVPGPSSSSHAKHAKHAKHPHVTATVNVPKTNHPLLIGKSGATINALRAEFNVEIRIPPKDSTSDSIQVIGSDHESVSAAAARISQIGTGTGRPGSSSSRSPRPSHSAGQSRMGEAAPSKPPSGKSRPSQ